MGTLGKRWKLSEQANKERRLLRKAGQRRTKAEILALWKKKNPEKAKALRLRYYIKNRERLLVKSKLYRDRSDIQIREKERHRVYFQKNYPKLMDNLKRKKAVNPYFFWSHSVIQAHKARGFIVDFNGQWLEDLAKSTPTCFLCECKFDWFLEKKGRQYPDSPSLDRIENEKTLTKENVQIICILCNMTKGARNMKDFIAYCKMISKKYET